ncbi:hypothetical protein BEP19_14400 [Ammoniphilus oxalaticus]|uniref:Uncharacterized protein n=1 Tax=Ammoniphilus oxalaticus TaxID=66863 RepID=A0A419SER4_9BACL|nr:tetratricopeptide repeat protein [Ammoniphilus oxalaticus]RKD21803.1 hypothetical protein BEP19_14400 [Ammoniphilus oxalaticus]
MSSNIISLKLTADFFAERANRSLDRYNYSKALRYFKRAGEMEPKNPSHLCNMAGVLGHLGKFSESNEILMNVLKKFDDNAAECHYYLACNYVYMDLLEQAEEHAYLYLRKDPKGRFAKDAVEILEYVAQDLNHPPLTEDLNLEEDEKTILHEQARTMMEEGRFQQAEKLLSQLLEDHPDFIAARNNLSLCYYYKGEIEKAHQMIRSVLEQDPCNIHALCNLAILYYQQQELEELSALLKELRKIIPLQYDQAYKLGITLGVLGEHDAAYQLFKKMSAYAWRLDFHLYHYCAVSAFNLGRYQEAKKYWKWVQREDPESPIAPYYLDWIESGQTHREAPYYYQVPHHYQESKKKEALQDSMERDPFIRSSFLWALRHGDRETKLQVLQAFEWLGDQEVIEALKEFVADPEQEDDLKQMANFVLGTLGYAGSNQPTIRWRSSWKEVVNCLRDRLTGEEQEAAQQLWTEFIQARYPNVPIIRKPKAWAAALEYLITPTSYKELAQSYSVSAQTVKKNVDTIREK